MLVFDLNPIFKLRGITRKYTFLKKIGLTHMTAQRLARGEVKTMKNDHIEKVCLALHCTPNDLMRWSQEPDQVVADNHPLHQLKKQEENIDLLAELRDLPVEKLNELKTFLREVKQ